MIDTTNIPLPHSVRFAEKWLEWVQFRKDIKKSYKTQRGVTMALNKLKAVSETEAIEMIDNSMTNEYQGLYAKKKEKEETPKTYITPKPKELSNYKPKEYNQEKAKDFIINKIKQAYEGNVTLNDVGGVYTNRLKDHLSTPDHIKEKIQKEVEERAKQKPKNKYEDLPEINIDLEVRNRILKFNIRKYQEAGVKIYKSI